jgi:transcriptional repressor NrdR
VKIVKKDGTREPFDHAKIKRGLEKACWKRPIRDTQLEAGDRIEAFIHKQSKLKLYDCLLGGPS